MTKNRAKSILPVAHWDLTHRRRKRLGRLRLSKWDYASLAELVEHLEEFTERRSTKFLEVGCAPARYMVYFNQVFGWEVAGIELSEPGLLVSRSLLEANGIKACLYAGDVLEIEPDDQYDVVASFGLIEHFDDPLPCYRAMNRWIRPGGAMIVTVPNLLGPEGWAMRRRNYQFYLGHRRYSAVDLSNHCKAIGLRVVFCGLVGNSYIPYVFEPNKSTGYQHLVTFPTKLLNTLVHRTAKAIKRPIRLGPPKYIGCVALKDR